MAIKWTYEKIKEYIEGSKGNGCKLLMTKEEFESVKAEQNESNSHVKLKILCGMCCKEFFYVSIKNFKGNKKKKGKKQCNNCAIIKTLKKLTKTHEEFVKEVYDLVGNEYTVLGTYINSKTKLLMRHNSKKCNNHEFMMTPNDFLGTKNKRGSRCPECSGLKIKTTKKFKQDIYNLVGDEYTVLGEYISSTTDILMRHNICKSTFLVTPSHFLQGTRCTICNNSKGNRRVKPSSFLLITQ